MIQQLFTSRVVRMLVIMNIPLIGLFVRLLAIPYSILVPTIAAVSFVGVYGIHATTFDLVLMVLLGIARSGTE